MSDGCKQRQLLCPNCQVLHVARHSNSMYPTVRDVTHSLGEKEREPLLGLHADRQGLCSPNMHGAGGQSEFLAGFQSREIGGGNERWEENGQHGAGCCVKLELEDDDRKRGKSASVEAPCVEGRWRAVIMYPLASSRLCH